MGLIACPDCGQMVSDIAPSCPHCGRPIFTQDTLPPLPSANQLEEGKDADDSDKIHVTRKGEPLGSYTKEKARQYFIAGQLLPTDWGWHDGMGEDWKPLNEVLGLPVSSPPTLAPQPHAPSGLPSGCIWIPVAITIFLLVGLALNLYFDHVEHRKKVEPMEENLRQLEENLERLKEGRGE